MALTERGVASLQLPTLIDTTHHSIILSSTHRVNKASSVLLSHNNANSINTGHRNKRNLSKVINDLIDADSSRLLVATKQNQVKEVQLIILKHALGLLRQKNDGENLMNDFYLGQLDEDESIINQLQNYMDHQANMHNNSSSSNEERRKFPKEILNKLNITDYEEKKNSSRYNLKNIMSRIKNQHNCSSSLNSHLIKKYETIYSKNFYLNNEMTAENAESKHNQSSKKNKDPLEKPAAIKNRNSIKSMDTPAPVHKQLLHSSEDLENSEDLVHPLQYLIFSAQQELHHLNLDYVDRNGSSGLFHCSWHNYPVMLLLLCEAGANVNHINIRNNSPIDLAIEKFNLDCIKLLLRFGSTITFSQALKTRIKSYYQYGIPFVEWLFAYRNKAYDLKEPTKEFLNYRTKIDKQEAQLMQLLAHTVYSGPKVNKSSQVANKFSISSMNQPLRSAEESKEPMPSAEQSSQQHQHSQEFLYNFTVEQEPPTSSAADNAGAPSMLSGAAVSFDGNILQYKMFEAGLLLEKCVKLGLITEFLRILNQFPSENHLELLNFSSNGCSLLYTACYMGDYSLVRFLLSRGVEANQLVQDQLMTKVELDNYLHKFNAAPANRSNIPEALSALSPQLKVWFECNNVEAAPDSLFSFLTTPIHICFLKKFYQIALLLLSHGAACPYSPQQLLQLCRLQIQARKLIQFVKINDLFAVVNLISDLSEAELQAVLNYTEINGINALVSAVSGGNIDILSWLLDRGCLAYINHKIQFDLSALDVAMKLSTPRTIKLLQGNLTANSVQKELHEEKKISKAVVQRSLKMVQYWLAGASSDNQQALGELRKELLNSNLAANQQFEILTNNGKPIQKKAHKAKKPQAKQIANPPNKPNQAKNAGKAQSPKVSKLKTTPAASLANSSQLKKQNADLSHKRAGSGVDGLKMDHSKALDTLLNTSQTLNSLAHNANQLSDSLTKAAQHDNNETNKAEEAKSSLLEFNPLDPLLLPQMILDNLNQANSFLQDNSNDKNSSEEIQFTLAGQAGDAAAGELTGAGQDSNAAQLLSGSVVELYNPHNPLVDLSSGEMSDQTSEKLSQIIHSYLIQLDNPSTESLSEYFITIDQLKKMLEEVMKSVAAINSDYTLLDARGQQSMPTVASAQFMTRFRKNVSFDADSNSLVSMPQAEPQNSESNKESSSIVENLVDWFRNPHNGGRRVSADIIRKVKIDAKAVLAQISLKRLGSNSHGRNAEGYGLNSNEINSEGLLADYEHRLVWMFDDVEILIQRAALFNQQFQQQQQDTTSSDEEDRVKKNSEDSIANSNKQKLLQSLQMAQSSLTQFHKLLRCNPYIPLLLGENFLDTNAHSANANEGLSGTAATPAETPLDQSMYNSRLSAWLQAFSQFISSNPVQIVNKYLRAYESCSRNMHQTIGAALKLREEIDRIQRERLEAEETARKLRIQQDVRVELYEQAALLGVASQEFWHFKDETFSRPRIHSVDHTGNRLSAMQSRYYAKFAKKSGDKAGENERNNETKASADSGINLPSLDSLAVRSRSIYFDIASMLLNAVNPLSYYNGQSFNPQLLETARKNRQATMKLLNSSSYLPPIRINI
jgi:hypothetical protein